ncbi:MAG: hypothetical protein SFU53_14595 [Terrimicrobiaceae bacterium]|nr:hypothetical protein [Terrimicrobiaceae bacterium]
MNQDGFSLVEVTLAVGITAFCLVAIFGLLPIGLNTNRAAFEQTAALHQASAVVADIASTPAGLGVATNSSTFGVLLPALGAPAQQSAVFLSDAGLPVTTAADARYLAVVSVAPPPADFGIAPTRLHILMTWPAAPNAGIARTGTNLRAALTNVAGSVETTSAIFRR